MNPLIYLDCYAAVGKQGPKDELVPWKTETLLAEMEHCGIHGALVYHNVAAGYDPSYGNNMLAAETAKSPRLFPMWVVMPHHCEEMPPGRRLVDKMLESGVRAVRLRPKYQSWSMDPNTTKQLFDALESEQILTSIDISQTDYETVAEVASRHPRLPILLTGTVWSQPRTLIPTMDRCENIQIEFSSQQANYALERFAARYGAERLLFGTQAMVKSPGAAKAFVDYADLTDADRKAIAGGNLARLLHLEELPQHYEDRPEGRILSRVKHGEPLEHITVIDSHAHMGHEGAMGVGLMPMPQSDIDNMISRNRRLGIDRIAISSWLGIWADCEEGNHVLRRAADRYPKDVIGYATLDPNYLDEEEFDRWMRLAHLEWKFPGMKPYFPRVRIPYDSPRYHQWYRFGNEHKLFCLLHSSGGGFVSQVASISKLFPDISFLLAHSGTDFPTARERLPLVNERDNVYLEITLTAVTYGVIEYMVREAGAEKVLFGTDAPMRDPIPQFGWMTYAHCSDEELELMLGKNMEGILARCEL